MGLKVWIEPIEVCISDFVCVAICPEVFVADQRTGKVAIRREYRVNPGDALRGVVDEVLEDCIKMSAENCPVDIIHYSP